MSCLARTPLVVVVLAAALFVVGCSTTPSASSPVSGGGPAWIDQPNGAYDEGSARVVYAVGIAANNPNPATRRNMALTRGRTELARTLSTMVQGMVKDYMSTNRDFYDSNINRQYGRNYNNR